MTAGAASLRAWQRRTLALCFAGYTVSYLMRTNLSAVLDKLIVDLQISRAMAGGIGTLYFWMYAAGQFLNGYLAERLNPKRMVAVGLAASALINGAMALSRSYPLMLCLWGLNGYCLSMVWTPTFKILTNWYGPDEYRRISVLISLPTTIGYLISWSAVRALAAWASWPMAFLVPALVGALFLAAWTLLLRPTRASAGLPEDGEPAPEPGPARGAGRSPVRLLIGFGLIFVGAMAVIQGLIKESINLWGPTLMGDLGGAQFADLSMLFSIGIPIAGTLGILAVGQIIKAFRGSAARALLLLFGVGAGCAALIYFARPNLAATALLLSALMACVCGANVAITVFLPTGFVRQGIAAQVSGMLNFMVYLGAGLGGSLSGWVSDRWGWGSMYLLWAGLSLSACAVVAAWARWTGRRARGGAARA